MRVTIDLECRSCHYRDHSGSFTQGGAREICGRPEACSARRSFADFKREYPGYAVTLLAEDSLETVNFKEMTQNGWKHHWYHRIIENEIENGGVPNWCPIKAGFPY